MLRRLLDLKTPPHSFVLPSFLLILVLLLALNFYEWYQEKPVSIPDFRKCQQLYCNSLAAFFNTPMEWRIVLDISKSYLNPQQPDSNGFASQRITSLISTLPIAKGDSFCLDSFGLTYHRGHCKNDIDPRWVRRVADRPDYFSRQIETLVPEDTEKTKVTDFHGTLTDLYRRDLSREDGISCGIKSRRRYYLFLTDGKNDPDNLNKFIPLFSEGSSGQGFARDAAKFILPQPIPSRACPNFAQLVRGLYFVIDQGVARPEVQENWTNGKQVFDSLRNAAENMSARAFLPNVALWLPDQATLDPDVDIRAEVDRKEGVFPCLQTGSVVRSPHNFPFPEPHLLTSRCNHLLHNGFEISLPSSVLSRGQGKVKLPFYTLQRGQSTDELQVTLRSLDALALDEPRTLPAQIPVENHRNWVSQRFDFELDFSGSALETQRLPVKVSYNFRRDESKPPFLDIYFPRANAKNLLSFLASEPGRLPIILATCFLILCGGCLILTESTDKSLRITQWCDPSNHNRGSEQRVVVHQVFDRNGVRLFLDRHHEFIAAAKLRSEGSIANESFFIHGQDCVALLDIIPFASVIYYAYWCRGDDEVRDGKSLTTKHGINASMYPPKTTWVPDFEEANLPSGPDRASTLSQSRNLADLYFPTRLRWPALLSAERQSRDGDTKAHVFELGLTWRHRRGRFLLAIFQTVAFSATIVAALQIWFPALYEFIYEESPIGGLSVCWKMLLVSFSVMFSGRAFYIWKVAAEGSLSAPLFRKIYAFSFWWLFCSSWLLVLLSSWGSAARFGVFALLGMAVFAFIFCEQWWVDRRLKEGHSFRVMDQIMDSAHRLLPLTL